MRRMLTFSAVLFGAIILLLAGLNFYVHVTLRDAAIGDEIEHMEQQAELRAQEIENSMLSIRFALEKAQLLWQVDGSDPRRMHEHLKSLEQQLAYARAITIVDADGTPLYSSRILPASPANVARREAVAYYLDGGTEKFHIGLPSKNSIDGEWQLPVSIGAYDALGRLSGVIVAILDPRAYSSAFHNAVEDGDYVTLLTADFRLIARSPWLEEEMGNSLLRSTAYQALAAGNAPAISGVFTNPFSGAPRIAAVRRLLDNRLVISSSRWLDTAIANWRSQAIIVGLVSALILLLGTAAITVLALMLAERDNRAEDLARVNRELQEQTSHAERLATVKSEFLATMSHEIRTPMNGVLGMAQALENMPLEPTVREYVAIIRESAESLLGIINDILDFSRLEAGRMKVSPGTVRLSTLLETMTTLFSPACTQKKVAFRIEIDPAAVSSFETDPMRLRQILVNLIGNAVKFTSQGAITLRVGPAILPDERPGIRFEVEDSGTGIAPAAMDSIFERFAQEDASAARQFGGTGLGLAICRRLTTLLGGDIGCESEKGVGSLFWLELPLELPEVNEVDEARNIAAGPVLDTGDRSPRVLCVDDNHVNRRIVETLLRPFCDTLVLAASGAEAVTLARSQSFDAILLDIHMPGMDGVETHHRLRALPGGRYSYIVALTADVVPEALARYEMAGFNAVVAKPVELEKLLKILGLQPRV